MCNWHKYSSLVYGSFMDCKHSFDQVHCPYYLQEGFLLAVLVFHMVLPYMGSNDREVMGLTTQFSNAKTSTIPYSIAGTKMVKRMWTITREAG